MSHISTSKNSNSGIITFRTQAAGIRKKTVVITGPARSGTTMMAQIVQTLGVHLGDTVDVNLLEDLEIRSATREADMEKMEALIEERNQKSPIWGWKYPGSLEHLSKFSSSLRNPFVIFTFRDPIATSVRNQIGEEETLNLIDTVDDALNYMKLAMQWIRDHDAPCMCVSYEKALLNPESLVDEVMCFLQIEANETDRFAAIEQVQLGNTRYLSAKLWETHLGFIDSIHDGVISGWAHIKESSEPANLEVRVNLKKVATIVADQFREDLKQNDIGDGLCGFTFEIGPYLQREVTNRVEVCFADSEYPLQGSPKFL